MWLLPVAALLGGCAAPGEPISEPPPPVAPEAQRPLPFVALQGCAMLVTSSPFPRPAVEAAVPDDFIVLGSAPGQADVELAAWSCDAIAVDNATVVTDAVLAFLTVVVQARNESWNRPGHFSEFLLEAWVGDERLAQGLPPFGLPTRHADGAHVGEAGARLEAGDASHRVAAVGGSLGGNPFGGDLGVRHFGVDAAGSVYAWDVTADVAQAEFLPRLAEWGFQGGHAETFAGGPRAQPAHVQSFVANYAFEVVRFEEPA